MRSSATATSSAIRSRCRARAAGSLVRRVPSSRRPSRCSSARVSADNRDRRSSCGVVTGCSRLLPGVLPPGSHPRRARCATHSPCAVQLIACTAQRVVGCTCSSGALWRPSLTSGAPVTDVLPAAGSAADAEQASLSDQLVQLVRVMHAFKAQATNGSGPEARERAAHVLLFPLTRLGSLRQGSLAE